MKFLLFTILNEENQHLIGDFLQKTSELTLPVRIAIVDSRKRKFDETRKLIKNFTSKGVYFFSANSLNGNDPLIAGLFHGKSENYLATAYINMDMEIDEFELTKLFVRAKDLGAVVPKTNLIEEGLGFYAVIPTRMDLGVVYSKELKSDMIGYPEKVFALSHLALDLFSKKASDLIEGHERYRMFTINNIRFNLVDNCIFNQKREV